MKDHFLGEGNAARIVMEVYQPKDRIHYKNEQSMTFELFLIKCQKMYNIYRDEGEELNEDTFILFYLKRHLSLQ